MFFTEIGGKYCTHLQLSLRIIFVEPSSMFSRLLISSKACSAE
jgi:hypothetical protein